MEAARRNIPINIRTLMANRGVTRLQIMQKAGMSKPTLSERLSGKSAFKADELAAIAELLRVEVGTLYMKPEDLINSRCYLEGLPTPLGQQHLPGIIPPPMGRNLALAG